MSDEPVPYENLYFGVSKDIRARNVKLYWGGDNFHVYTKTISKGMGITGPATMALTYDQAQDMVTQLWYEGIRPKDVALEQLKDEAIARLEEIVRRYKEAMHLLVDIPHSATTLKGNTGEN